MSISLKRRVGMTVATVVLLVAAIFIFPRVAEAQGTASVESTQSAVPSQPASELATRLAAAQVVVVAPGDSLWSISQEQLHPNASSQQIMNEVGRIYELNRNRIGDDPDLILVGQELLMPPVADQPAATAPSTTAEPAVVAELTVSERVAEEPVALPALPEAEAVPAAYMIAKPSPAEPYFLDRWLLGLWILALNLVLTILMAFIVWMLRDVLREQRRESARNLSSPWRLTPPRGSGHLKGAAERERR